MVKALTDSANIKDPVWTQFEYFISSDIEAITDIVENWLMNALVESML